MYAGSHLHNDSCPFVKYITRNLMLFIRSVDQIYSTCLVSYWAAHDGCILSTALLHLRVDNKGV